MKRSAQSPQSQAETDESSVQAKPKRLRYALAGLGVLTVAALSVWLTGPTVSRGPNNWPEQLTSGSASGFNVLVITLDTTRADHLGCYGYAEADTPVLDTLAAHGVRFADAVTVVPVTLPAHVTIFTGLIPPHHGVRHNGEYRLAADRETLAEVLRDRGYRTAAFVSAFVLDARFGLDQGFDVYDDNVGIAAAAAARAFAKPIYERKAVSVTSAAVRWLKDRPRDRPFFCWVHYFDPHGPYQPPSPYRGRFAKHPYDGEIAYMDSQIGRLMTALDVTASRNNTLVIVVADHGESLGEHGEATHAKLLYRSTMHVPLILSCPGLFHDPRVVDRVVVSTADIFPTVLDLLGIEKTRPVDGQSLLTAHADRDRMIYQETLAPYLDNGWSPLHAMRRHEDKYILAPRPEYYDLRSDPGELKNLYEKVSGVPLANRDKLVAALSARMAKWPSVETVAAAAQTLDPEGLRRLESLGYVGSVSDVDASGALPDPKDMLPLLRKVDQANALSNAGRHEEALALLKEDLTVAPRDRNALITLGKLYIEMNRIPEAEKTFRTVLAIKPTARVCVLLAQILLADGRLEAASDLLDQAQRLSPRHGGIFLARGDLYTRRRRPQEAIAAYRHAKEVDPYRAATEAEARIKQLEQLLRTIPASPPPRP